MDELRKKLIEELGGNTAELEKIIKSIEELKETANRSKEVQRQIQAGLCSRKRSIEKYFDRSEMPWRLSNTYFNKPVIDFEKSISENGLIRIDIDPTEEIEGYVFNDKGFSCVDFYLTDFTSCAFGNVSDRGIYICNFKEVMFNGCTFKNYHITNSDFLDVTFHDKTILENVYFSDNKMLEVRFNRGIYKNLKIKNCQMERVVFYSSNITHLRMENVEMHDVDFRECTIRGLKWSDMNKIDKCTFVKCTLINPDFGDAKDKVFFYDCEIVEEKEND